MTCYFLCKRVKEIRFKKKDQLCRGSEDNWLCEFIEYKHSLTALSYTSTVEWDLIQCLYRDNSADL